MYSYITLNRGLDLKLQGGLSSDAAVKTVTPKEIAVVPDDFPGFTPKVAAKAGEHVSAGQPLLIDKNNEQIAIVSPVSGTVGEIVRGNRRKILRVTVTPDASFETIAQTSGKGATEKEAIKKALKEAGLWVMMRQLPYDVVPESDTTPKNIFITTFDSAPLAPELLAMVSDKASAIKAGIKALLALTDGNIYLGVRSIEESASVLGKDLESSPRVIVAQFKGKHPAGLASIQAANLSPINKGETAWLLDIVTLARIGDVLTSGQCDWSTNVALTGSEVSTPQMIKTSVGADLKSVLNGVLKTSEYNQRVISGNVLTGMKSSLEGYLQYPYRQVTVIPEGDDVDEFMGWASMSPNKMSQTRTFISRLLPGKLFAPDARLNGGRRAMIMSEEYEKVLPMDIMAEFLIKAIIARDIDKMEALGIYEVTPADFALCEYVDPSKLELQKIVREGLDYLRKELS